ncbi:MAG: Eco57I restriction-modification methylase domain-containing protein [Candidatus Pacebacteria bacterium]|nr:Eco57I restriction-modification methylase domain-containing protein [Candidatus Paceibacterota bacterium]
MSKLPTKIQGIQDELSKLSEHKTFEQTQRVILSVIRLVDDTVSVDDLDLFQLFNDSDGKIRANASWFYEDQVIADRKATYKVHADNKINLDFKVYGVNRAKKQVISWATALTPNFEDEPFNTKFNIGIDFVVPKSTDRVIIVLTNNYVIRTLELKDDITATYQEILAKWAEIKDFSKKPAVHTALWESFDLQPLNKKFYAGISELFIILRQYLIKENILDEKQASMFANRLIGRVIFTWFLDKKGIINRDLKYFDSQSFESDTEYYKTKLERLFFGVLNTPTDEREYKDEVTPFLNGGLFEVRNNDLYKDNKLSFPKNYFDDLFEFLSGYNFTTDESTSQFQQVAIDPEMLGRIFENLLAEITEETGEQARKAKGAFYTPREVVDYMCKESLKEYLKTKLPEDTYRDQRLYQLIEAPDKDFQDQDHNWRRDWKPYKDAILSALDDLKVLDPACGSGAFPIGMLQLLVRVYERLEPRFDGYKAKLQIIERNIYGVDIEPMAVEIARLRTWLSIIVDEESDSKKIKPLPNLEFKFVCANSLIDLDQDGATTFGDDPDLENKLRIIRDAYFNTESLAKKKKLRSDYNLLVNTSLNLFGESERSLQLKTYRPFDNESSASFFNPDFMFGVNHFNIVIGNPPYLRIQGLQKTNALLVEQYKKSYISATGSFDLYVLFAERGLKLLNTDGFLNFIMPDKWLNSSFGLGLRKVAKQSGSLHKVISFKESQIFNASTYSSLVWFTKAKHSGIQFFEFPSGISGATILGQLSSLSDEKMKFHLIDSSVLDQDKWTFTPTTNQAILKKISGNSPKLKDVFSGVFQGIATGMDDVFFVTQISDGENGLIKVYSKAGNKEYLLEEDMLMPVLKGNQVHRYEKLETSVRVVFPYTRAKKDNASFGVKLIPHNDLESKYPSTFAYFKEFEKELRAREKSSFDDDQWFRFSRNQGISFPAVKKLVAPYLSLGSQFTFDRSGHFLTNTKCYSYLPKDEEKHSLLLLLGILNSKLTWFFISSTSSVMRGGYCVYSPEYLKSFSFPEKNDLSIGIEELTEKRLSVQDRDQAKEIEKKIDELVLDLYGLTDEEKEVVRSSLK